MQDVFLGMAGAEPERATRIDSISIARAQLCCQANSGAISYRQEKILQVTPRISCRQEFHFWNGRRRDNVPDASPNSVARAGFLARARGAGRALHVKVPGVAIPASVTKPWTTRQE